MEGGVAGFVLGVHVGVVRKQCFYMLDTSVSTSLEVERSEFP